MPPLRIGMFGGGVVGGGVYEIVETVKKAFFQSIGANVTIVKICVRDASKPRSFVVGAHTTIVTDYEAILGDSSINCVIELMGGTTHAKDVVFEAIRRGKSVITANKALLAEYLPTIRTLLKENAGVSLAYEAAVCGGIPIINSLQQDFVGDDISKVMGIMNGTTNFMLTKMELEGADYSAVLAEAQALGYAEADPTADVEGHDVQAKIALLAKLAFGQDVAVAGVPCAGISRLSAVDFANAKALGCTVKLLGTAMRVTGEGSGGKGGDRLAVFVSPTMVPLVGALAATRGPGNIVVLQTKNMGESTYTGPGAGRYPTANSVVSDILRMAKGACGDPWPFQKEWQMDSDYSARFYLRFAVDGGGGSDGAVEAAADAAGVTVATVLPQDDAGGFVALITEVCKHSAVQAMCKALGGKVTLAAEPLVMPLA